MKRDEVLRRAHELIHGDRADSYGDFKDQMERVAEIATALMRREGAILAKDVAYTLMALKLVRSTTSSDADSMVDLCGYAALFQEHFGEDDDA